MELLTRKTKAILVVGITILLIILLVVIGYYDMGPTRIRRGWVGYQSKYRAPGDNVYFNYTVESSGGRILFHMEFINFQSEWDHIITPNPMVVHPGQIRTIRIEVDVPHNAEIGERMSVNFNMRWWRSMYGERMGGGQNTETVTIEVRERSEIDYGEDDEWNVRSWGVTHCFDERRMISSLYIIPFVLIVILFLIPELVKFNRKRIESRE